MKSKMLFFFFLVYSGSMFSQNAIIQSFEYTVRHLNPSIIPNYTSNLHFQDSVLLVISEALKKKFKVKEVLMPSKIGYKFYSSFNKSKLIMPENIEDSFDYNVIILSTFQQKTESSLSWFMEILVQKSGITSFSNKTEHELECYIPCTINSDLTWIEESEFTKLFASQIDELVDNTKKLPQKIIIGSQKDVDISILMLIPNAEKLKMITSGSFMSKNDFSVSVEKDQKVLSNVVYHKRGKSSKGKANFGDWLLATVSTSVLGNGSSSSYMKKKREIRLGDLEFSNGEIHKLKMEWEQSVEKEVVNEVENDGLIAFQTGYVEQLTPMKIEIVKNNVPFGNLTYFREGEIFVVDGELQNHPINVTYAPSNNLLRVSENNEIVLIVYLKNVNPESLDSFAGKKITKKVFSSNNNKLPEWYNVYVKPNLNETDTANYMEAVFCLFFGIGNHS